MLRWKKPGAQFQSLPVPSSKMLLATTPRSCDKCKANYHSSGMEVAHVFGWILYLCPKCRNVLWKIILKFMDSK